MEETGSTEDRAGCQRCSLSTQRALPGTAGQTHYSPRQRPSCSDRYGDDFPHHRRLWLVSQSDGESTGYALSGAILKTCRTKVLLYVSTVFAGFQGSVCPRNTCRRLDWRAGPQDF
ncbi:hypothetical protein LDENG_00075760 [Lucifuga dentata]|nr:hypothetical protein LDENG_00075760 [Lucifuga dentata]